MGVRRRRTRVQDEKPVALGFLDYSTLERRRTACHEEVHVKLRLAPGIYLGVLAIVRTHAGFGLAPEHADGAIEYVVEMRSFRNQDTLAGLIAAGALSPEHVDAVARRLAAFHRTATVVARGGPGTVLATWRKNVKELDDAAVAAGRQWRIDAPTAFGESFVRAPGARLSDAAATALCATVTVTCAANTCSSRNAFGSSTGSSSTRCCAASTLPPTSRSLR